VAPAVNKYKEMTK